MLDGWRSLVGRAAAAGAVAGLALGLLGRLAMAALTVVGGGQPRFSLGGSFEVVAFGFLVGLPAAAVFVVLLRLAPDRAVLKGLVFGLALFTLLLLVPPPAARSAASGASTIVRQSAVALFAAVFAAYGLLLGWLTRCWVGPAARAVAVLALLALGALPARSDWLVYVGGDLQETRGAWATSAREVLFYAPGGAMQSIAIEDVDLPASAFLSWQASGRRQAPGLAPRSPATAAPGEPATTAPCLPLRVAAIPTAETYEVVLDGKRETVHLACLDAPEVQYDLADLAWFGRAAGEAVGGLVRHAGTVCLREEEVPRRDAEGHRVAYLELDDGRDLGGEVIARGFGLVRAGPCGRGETYRGLEDQARADQRGHWGRAGTNAAFAALSNGMAGSAAGSALPKRPRAASG